MSTLPTTKNESVILRNVRPYTVLDMPSMQQINARPKKWTAVSTFSGCGGASVGMKMANLNVLWANEFIPGALRSYRANASENTICDGRDIREVQGREILRATGLRRGELDFLDGSPPCFPAGELVRTARGMIPIEDVVCGDRVLTHLNRWRKVTNTMSRLYEGDTAVISTRGTTKLPSTPEHPYLVRRRTSARRWDEPAWIDAGDLKRGDLLAIQLEENDRIWVPVRHAERKAFKGIVYNISVEEDETYTVNGIVVHNCKMYSSAARHNRIGKKADERVLYSEGVYQRVDDLFDNHIRILRELMPKIAMIENVMGMAQSSSVGALTNIVAAFRESGYQLEIRGIAPIYLGVPQTRTRLVFLGIRNDLWKRGLRHAWPAHYRTPIVNVRDVVPEARWISRGKGEWKDARNPSPTLTVTAGDGDEFSGLSAAPFYKDEHGHTFQYSIPQMKRLFSFPDDFVLGGQFRHRYERLARAHAPLAVYNIAGCIMRHMDDVLGG